jgi:hypothetical protein
VLLWVVASEVVCNTVRAGLKAGGIVNTVPIETCGSGGLPASEVLTVGFRADGGLVALHIAVAHRSTWRGFALV